MSFILFVLVNATLFLRPAELAPELTNLPFGIYEALILSCLALSLPQILGYHLRRTQVAIFQHFSRTVAAKEDITPGLFGMLQVIAANSGIGQSRLAETMEVDRSTIVKVVDQCSACARSHKGIDVNVFVVEDVDITGGLVGVVSPDHTLPGFRGPASC